MDNKELINLLNNRSGAWLGRKLGFERPRQSVHQWIRKKNPLPIPEIHHAKIREVCAQ